MKLTESNKALLRIISFFLVSITSAAICDVLMLTKTELSTKIPIIIGLIALNKAAIQALSEVEELTCKTRIFAYLFAFLIAFVGSYLVIIGLMADMIIITGWWSCTLATLLACKLQKHKIKHTTFVEIKGTKDA